VCTSKGREDATNCELSKSGQVEAKARQGLKEGKASGQGAPRQRVHSVKFVATARAILQEDGKDPS
jgi:hypothetical protein